MPSESPDRVLIFDTTLRDGEQSPGISLNTTEKLEIAHQLARLGVDIIEAGFPIASPGDFEAVQAIAARGRMDRSIAGLARANPADVERAWEAVRDAERPRIHTFVSTSDIHIVHQLQSTREDVKGLARASVAQAREFCEDVEFSPMDATRADVEFTAEVIQIALDEGATTINIPDTVGYAMPQEYAALPDQPLRARAGLRDVVLSVHCHDDLGLAVANSFAGVLAGARQVECAINGIGERAGNASLEEIVMLLHTRQADVGLRTGVVTPRDRAHQPPGQPPDRLSGAAQQGDRRAQRLRPRVGHPPGRRPQGALDLRDHGRAPRSGWTPTSSCWASTPAATRCARRSRSWAITVDGQVLNTAFKRFKELADKKKQVTAMDLEALVTDELREELRRATRWSGSTSRPHRAVRRTRPSACGRPTATRSQGSFTGDGPVDAMFRAINAATGLDARLREFRVDAVTGGQDALGEVSVVVELGANAGERVGLPGVLLRERATGAGQAVATDIIEAAGIAYVRALTNAVRRTRTGPPRTSSRRRSSPRRDRRRERWPAMPPRSCRSRASTGDERAALERLAALADGARPARRPARARPRRAARASRAIPARRRRATSCGA